MPDLGQHAAFIIAAYGVTFLAVAALAFVIVEDDRKQRRLLAELEARGIRRRSARAPSEKQKTDRQADKEAPRMSEVTRQDQKTTPVRRFGVVLPLLIFACLAGLFWYALHGRDPSLLPSAMIGKNVPEFTLSPIEGLTDDGKDVPGFASSDLAQGEPTLVNVFASWCLECQEEHPLLVALAKEPGIRLFGIDYKDDAASARRFLGRYGNPYARVGADSSGRTAINFGVYGVPETYVITPDGRIAYRQVGPLTEQIIRDKLLPLLKPEPAKPTG